MKGAKESGAMKVLILTRSQDTDSTTSVIKELEDSGHQAVRFDTDLYPQDARLSSHYFGETERRILSTADFELDMAEVGGVYWRRFAVGRLLPDDLGEFRQACFRESFQTICGLFLSTDCFQLDPQMSVRLADHKELQTRWALQLGLECPRTLFSNDAAEVLKFSAEVGDVVAKMQAKVVLHRQGEQQAVFSNLLKSSDLEQMDGLRYSPMLFQENIPKARELRVIVVGKEIFSAAIDTGGSQRGEIDRRLDPELSFGWEPWPLPEHVATPLLQLVQRFGLNYSAADFILTPEGRYIFLEINAAGEWIGIARNTGLPIASAIARILTERGSRF